MAVIEIEKPEPMDLAAWFEELREWLDAHGCQGINFARIARHAGGLAYRLSFDDKEKAAQFSAQFARYCREERLPPTLGGLREAPA
jgi:hypothetical protein